MTLLTFIRLLRFPHTEGKPSISYSKNTGFGKRETVVLRIYDGNMFIVKNIPAK